MPCAYLCPEIAKLKDDLDKVTDNGGAKILGQLFLTYFFFCKAMARDFVMATLTVYFVNVMGVDTSTANNMGTAARSPFGIKTLWGSMSDAIPCLGFHKRFYILWGVSVASFSLLMLIILNPEPEAGKVATQASGAAVAIATILFFGFEYGGATVDSLTQARYTELMKMLGTPTIVSFVWFLISSCTLISAWPILLQGPGTYKILLYFALPMAAPMLIPASLNWLQEKPAKTFCSPDCVKVMQHKGIFALSMVLAFGALGGTLLIILQASNDGGILIENSAVERIGYYSTLSVTFVCLSFYVLPLNIAMPAFYMFLCSTLRLFFSSTLQVWYTSPNLADATVKCAAAEDCNPYIPAQVEQYYCIRNGPFFGVGYYNFAGNLIGAGASIAAVIIFEKFIVSWNVRAAFWVTTGFSMISCLFEVTILERANHSLFGTDPELPENQWIDQIFFVVGAQALDKIIEMLDFMPCNILIGQLCPPSMEASIFAVLAGSQNFGSNLANIFGSIVVEELGVVFRTREGEPFTCPNPDAMLGFSGLATARIIGGVFLPALTIPLTFVLLPDKQLFDKFLDDEDAEAGGNVELTGGGGGEVAAGEAGLAPKLNMARGMSGVSTGSYIALGTVSRSGANMDKFI